MINTFVYLFSTIELISIFVTISITVILPLVLIDSANKTLYPIDL